MSHYFLVLRAESVGEKLADPLLSSLNLNLDMCWDLDADIRDSSRLPFCAYEL